MDAKVRGTVASQRAPRAGVALALLLICTNTCAGTLTTQIDGVDDPLKAAVISAAEITKYDKQDISAAQVRRLYANAPEQIGKALEAYGYYNAKTDGELKESGQGWTAIIHVRAGEPMRVAEFAIDVASPASDEKPVAKALAEFAPKSGAQFDSAAYERSKAAVQSALYASGYLDATNSVHKVEVSRSANRAAIALKWDVGARYRFGKVMFEGSQLDEGFLDRYIPWHEGDFYSQSRLLRLQQKLIDADYFSIVDVLPDKEHAHDGVIPIRITLAPAKRNIYTAGVFVDSDVGVGVKGAMTRRWVNTAGHKLKVEAEIAQKQKSLSTTYTMPQPGENNRSYNFGAIFNDINTNTVQSRTFRFVANETREWQGFTRTLGLNYLTGNFTVATIDGSSSMFYPELVLERKKLDDASFVHNGYSITLDARASPGLLSDTKFGQVRGDAKWIHAIKDNQRVILRGTLGATYVGNFDALPPELRFFAGGNNSIRGYAFQGVGQPLADALVPIAYANCARNKSLDCNNLIIGGQNLVVASAEYEYYFTPTWGIATFVDTGDAFNSFSGYQNRIGTGIGLRYRSPVGMIRADIGVPVNDPTGKSGVQLHLIIGPDL
jgi:translocation and assembly module TamA